MKYVSEKIFDSVVGMGVIIYTYKTSLKFLPKEPRFVIPYSKILIINQFSSKKTNRNNVRNKMKTNLKNHASHEEAVII